MQISRLKYYRISIKIASSEKELSYFAETKKNAAFYFDPVKQSRQSGTYLLTQRRPPPYHIWQRWVATSESFPNHRRGGVSFNQESPRVSTPRAREPGEYLLIFIISKNHIKLSEFLSIKRGRGWTGQCGSNPTRNPCARWGAGFGPLNDPIMRRSWSTRGSNRFMLNRDRSTSYRP